MPVILSDQAWKRVNAAVQKVERAVLSTVPMRPHRATPARSAPLAIAVTLEPINYGTTLGGQCQIYTGTPGSETADTGNLVSAYPWMLNPGESIAANIEVVLARINGHWYCIAAACETRYSG